MKLPTRVRRTGGLAAGALLALGLAACASQSDHADAPAAPASASPSASPSPTDTVIDATPDPADAALRPPIGHTGDTDWHLVWHDEFSGDAFGPEWALRPTGAASGRSCASTTAAMGSVGDGYATFKVAHNPANLPAVDPKVCPTGRYFNAQWDTQRTKSFKYGVFAARMKFEHSEGMHGAFWLLPGPDGPAPAPDDPGQTGVEIDIAEYFGDDFGPGVGNGDYHAYIYWPQRQADGTIKNIKTGGAQNFKQSHAGLPSDGYHTYALEWTPNSYTFFLDGVETSRLTVGISQRAQFMLFSLLTSDWEVPKLTSTNVPASMSVDWVRVWQQQ
jgi:beta-glucanase (GH16 family)